MDCDKSKVGAVTVLTPRGALSQDDADAFADTLQSTVGESYGRLVLDFTNVPLLDSRGIEVLLTTTETLAQSGQTLKLCAVNELIREILDLTEVDGSFEHYEDANAAARSYL